MANGKEKPWKKWKDKHGDLKDEIDEMFKGAEPGEYRALIVNVENPISGYIVVKEKID